MKKTVLPFETYAKVVLSAEKCKDRKIFAARWAYMPEIAGIPWIDIEKPESNFKVLEILYDTISRPLFEIRLIAGLSQQQLANLFAIPVTTVRNWEQRGCCPIYTKLLIMQELGQYDPEKLFGVSFPRDKKE